jgi:RNA polymerase sigma factor, sigma-70 family
MFAVRDEEAALDVVQDSMLKLSDKYAERPAEELPLLFHRIIQNTIRDYYRRQKVRNFWTMPLSSLFSGDGDDDERDPLETLQAESDSNHFQDPARLAESAQVLDAIEDALKNLPARQREAFLLRYWENMDVATTAAAMGCSEGSVKTHCSRAAHALAALLEKKGISL